MPRFTPHLRLKPIPFEELTFFKRVSSWSYWYKYWLSCLNWTVFICTELHQYVQTLLVKKSLYFHFNVLKGFEHHKLGFDCTEETVVAHDIGIGTLTHALDDIPPNPHFYLVYFRWGVWRSQPMFFPFLFLNFPLPFSLLHRPIEWNWSTRTPKHHLVKSEKRRLWFCPIQIYSHSICFHFKDILDFYSIVLRDKM
jgi:hypothetical protein